ncbi:MAG: S8 family serine peptidase, partial [Chloroflexota bacterium]
MNSLHLQDTIQRLVILAVIAVLAFGGTAVQQTAAAERERSDTPVTILVQFEPSDADEGRRALTGAATRDLQGSTPLRSRDDIVRLSYPDHDSAMRALLAFERDPDVRVAELNQSRELHWEPTDEELYEFQARWVRQVEYPDAWNITTGGEETIVAVLDSGASETHPDLVDQLVPGHVAVDDEGTTQDVDGHGTHVAGIIAADGSNGIGTAGTAMDVRIMPVRVLENGNGRISVDAIVDGIYWAIDNGADVLNLSLGADSASQMEREAIQYATNLGIPVIASSGNKSGQISYPASYPETIS